MVFDPQESQRNEAVAILKSAGFDAEVASDRKASDNAMAWWKPDVLLLHTDTRGACRSFVERLLRVRPSLHIVLYGPHHIKTMSSMAAECGAQVGYSTLAGTQGLVACVRELYDIKSKAHERPFEW